MHGHSLKDIFTKGTIFWISIQGYVKMGWAQSMHKDLIILYINLDMLCTSYLPTLGWLQFFTNVSSFSVGWDRSQHGF